MAAVVCAELAVLADDDPRQAIVAEQQLDALAALVIAAGEAGVGGEAGGRG